MGTTITRHLNDYSILPIIANSLPLLTMIYNWHAPGLPFSSPISPTARLLLYLILASVRSRGRLSINFPRLSVNQKASFHG